MTGDGVPGPERPRAIRVFVSSTFHDFQAERDELVKRVPGVSGDKPAASSEQPVIDAEPPAKK